MRQRLDTLVIAACQSKLLLHILALLKVVTQALKLLLRRLAGIQHRDMRAEQFVPREAVEIDAERLHVDGPVRRISDRIDAQQRARDLVHGLSNRRDVGDAAEDVGGVCACHQTSLVGQQLLEVGGEELGIGGAVAGLPPDDFEGAPFGDLDPGGDVGFVVESGDDEFGVRMGLKMWEEG